MATDVDVRIFEGMYDWLRQIDPPLSLPVNRPNDDDFQPPIVGGNPAPYLKISFLPANTTGYSVLHTGSNVHRGIMQVSVYWPRGQGSSAPGEIAGRIKEHFKRGTRFTREGTRVNIISPPSIRGPLDEPTMVHIPVSIGYFVTTPN